MELDHFARQSLDAEAPGDTVPFLDEEQLTRARDDGGADRTVLTQILGDADECQWRRCGRWRRCRRGCFADGGRLPIDAGMADAAALDEN